MTGQDLGGNGVACSGGEPTDTQDVVMALLHERLEQLLAHVAYLDQRAEADWVIFTESKNARAKACNDCDAIREAIHAREAERA